MTTTTLPAAPIPAKAAAPLYLNGHPATGRVLRAVILKEMRQNLVLVALAFLLMVIVALFGEYYRSGFLSYRYDPLNVLLYESVRASIPLACAVAAFILGVAQPLSDLNFDRWAFLMHRPVPRSMLFWGRALAGLLLYFIIAGVPLIALLLYGMTSAGGHYFVWQYTLPPIADFFTGTAYYFAGLLVADRQARYYGSRLVPLILAFAASFCASMSPWFLLAMFCNVCFATLLALGAWGSAVSHGYTLKAPAWLRMALAAGLFLACLILCGVPATVARLGINSARLPYSGTSEWWRVQSSTDYGLLTDGTFYKSTSVYKWANTATAPYGISDYSTTTYTDMEGHEIPAPPEQVFETRAYISPEQQGRRERRGYRDLDQLVVETMFAQPSRYPGDPVRTPEDHWYLDQTKNRYYLYKYPPEHYQWAGTLGENGFVAAPGLAQAFEDPITDYNSGVLTRRVLYNVDLQNATAKPLFTAPPGEVIRGYSYMNTSTSTQPALPVLDRLFILTDKQLFYLNRKGQTLAQLPVDRNVSDTLGVRYLPQKQWWVLIYYNTEREDPNLSNNYHYEFYDDAGKFVSSRDLQNTYDRVRTPEILLGESKVAAWNAEEGVAMAVSPWTQLGMGRFARWLAPTDADAARMLRAEDPDQEWIRTATFCLCLLIFVSLMRPLTAFYRLEHGWLWYLLALLTGPAALLTLLATQKIPGRIRCPVCNTPRPLVALTCPTCHAPWPVPAQTGTEIFT